MSDSSEVLASLHVGELHPEVTEAEVREIFGKHGHVISVKLCRNRSKGRPPLRYAYVNFASRDDATKALRCLNYATLRGHRMRVSWVQRDPTVRKTGIGNLYVKNLASSVTSTDLDRIFSEFGVTISCKAVEENGICKGYGFVQFSSEESAMTALSALDGSIIFGKRIFVSQFVPNLESRPQQTVPVSMEYSYEQLAYYPQYQPINYCPQVHYPDQFSQPVYYPDQFRPVYYPDQFRPDYYPHDQFRPVYYPEQPSINYSPQIVYYQPGIYYEQEICSGSSEDRIQGVPPSKVKQD